MIQLWVSDSTSMRGLVPATANRIPREIATMNSELEQAKKDVATYLKGDHVAEERLMNACRVLNQQNSDAVRRLRESMLADSQRAVVCMRFLANLAEFCEMSSRERLQEMPELVLHVFDCDDCRQAVWAIKRGQIWSKISSTTTPIVSLAQTTIKDLTTCVRFTLDKVNGMLTWDQECELLFGNARPAMAMTMGKAPGMDNASDESCVRTEPEPVLRKEWCITDDETGFAFRFCTRPKPGSDVTILELGLLKASGEPVPHSQVGVEVTNDETSELHASCPLDLLDDAPLELGLGRWSVELRYGEPPNKNRWRFHFEFQPQMMAGI